jgi:hypothetical protein
LVEFWSQKTKFLPHADYPRQPLSGRTGLAKTWHKTKVPEQTSSSQMIGILIGTWAGKPQS